MAGPHKWHGTLMKKIERVVSQSAFWDTLVVGTTMIHVLMAPYTKVEESFNTQAMHDLLYHRHQLHKYDHLEFPGVVPRTFTGAIVVSTLSSPIVWSIGMWESSKVISLLIVCRFFVLTPVRLVLGALVLFSLYLLRLQIYKKFGHQVSLAYTLLTLLQFHLLFYATRPLPNIFASIIVNLAYAFWIAGKPGATLECLVFAAVVFRCDVILLLGPIGLSLLLRREIDIWSAAKHCFIVSMLSIGLTGLVDSVMWGRWLWPEMEVFWFNSVLNRSSEWGVSPMHWYFTSALPRAMLSSYPLLYLGLVLERRISQFVIPVFIFVILYSKLAHKELRFILFAIPMLNLASAVALVRIYNNRKKPLWACLFIGLICTFLASSIIICIISKASYANYPGGRALEILHKTDTSSSSIPRVVHIGTLPAMTGVSRFCEKGPPWSYSKEEDLSVDDLFLRNFTYAISEHASIPGFSCLMAVEAFSKIGIQYSVIPIKLLYDPKVYIHGREGSMVVDGEHWPRCTR